MAPELPARLLGDGPGGPKARRPKGLRKTARRSAADRVLQIRDPLQALGLAVEYAGSSRYRRHVLWEGVSIELECAVHRTSGTAPAVPRRPWARRRRELRQNDASARGEGGRDPQHRSVSKVCGSGDLGPGAAKWKNWWSLRTAATPRRLRSPTNSSRRRWSSWRGR